MEGLDTGKGAVGYVGRAGGYVTNTGAVAVERRQVAVEGGVDHVCRAAVVVEAATVAGRVAERVLLVTGQRARVEMPTPWPETLPPMIVMSSKVASLSAMIWYRRTSQMSSPSTVKPWPFQQQVDARAMELSMATVLAVRSMSAVRLMV